jgi:hypothetical protein
MLLAAVFVSVGVMLGLILPPTATSEKDSVLPWFLARLLCKLPGSRAARDRRVTQFPPKSP